MSTSGGLRVSLSPVLSPLAYAVVGVTLLVMIVSAAYAARDRLMDDLLLGGLALLEVGLMAQVGIGVTRLGALPDSETQATFAAYLISLPFIPAGTAFLAIKEKTRWAMAAIAVGALAVGVMTVRLQQIWASHV